MSQLELTVADEEIAKVFAPGIQRVVVGEDEEWRAREERLNAKAFQRGRWWWRGLFRSGKLDSRAVYERTWSHDAALTRFTVRPDDTGPVVWRDQRYFASSIWIKRVHLLFLMRLIDILKPATVLEVGSGMGFNLFMLANRFPTVRFAGLELTSAGHQVAQSFRAEPTLPQQVRDFSPLPFVDERAHQQVELFQGTAAQLPLKNASVDLVFSVLALEQMELIRDRVFGEIARVCCGHVAMFEQFADFNQTPMRKAQAAQKGYFSASIADLSRFNFEPVFVTSDMPSKLSMGVGLVVAATKPRQP
jgi:ubiquinone/menaquinone biosynthesis C-methylase UbiE